MERILGVVGDRLQRKQQLLPALRLCRLPLRSAAPRQALAWNSEKAGCFLLGLFGTVMLIGVEVSTAWLPAYATLPCLPGLPSAVVLYLAPVLTHASGRRTPQYRFIQPFVGGRRYVALQGLGWTLYSVSLSLTLLLLLNHVPRGLSVAALLGLAAEVLILASLPLFEPLPGAPPPARPGRTTISSGILVGLSTAVFVGVDLLGAALEGALGVPSHHILAVGAVLGALAPLLAQSGVAGPMLSLTQLQEGGPEYEAFQVLCLVGSGRRSERGGSLGPVLLDPEPSDS